MRFDWPDKGSQEVKLAFHARSGSDYYLVYHPVPIVTAPTTSEDISDFAGNLGGNLLSGLILAAVAPPKVLFDGATRIQDSHAHVDYVDLLVVAKVLREGIVCKLRIMDSGEVVSR
jgi:hypothetical protein